MKLWPYIAFLKDLFDILPSRTDASWAQVDNLQPGRPTVILVSGFGATRRNVSVMRRRLLRDGFNVLVVALDWKNLSDGFRGFDRMAADLAGSIIALKKRADLRGMPLYIVAHSAGGLVARHYIQVLGGFQYCDALITLGTPHRGSWVALLGFPTHLALKARCLAQMLPISNFVRRINRARFPEGFAFVSISSPQDYLCRPGMARVPAKIAGLSLFKAVQIPDLSHSEFLMSKSAYSKVIEVLRHEVGLAIGTAVSAPAGVENGEPQRAS